jgi:hypothetical protein
LNLRNNKETIDLPGRDPAWFVRSENQKGATETCSMTNPARVKDGAGEKREDSLNATEYRTFVLY